jgi:hypothetical protein
MRLRFVLVLAAALVAGCASPPPLRPPPTTAEIVQMAKDGASAETIIQRIEALRGVYPLPASEFARLRAEGVPDQVIDYMQRTYLNATWFDGWQRGLDSSAFWGWPHARRAPPPYGWTSPYWVWR